MLTEGVEEPITSPDEATSEDLKKELGEIPRKNPIVTMTAARKTGERGVIRVARALMRMVHGRSKPRAIWKNDASTLRRQRVLNTKDMNVSFRTRTEPEIQEGHQKAKKEEAKMK